MKQEINVQNMNVELVAQMFKNYQSNVLFHLEGPFLSMEYLRIYSSIKSYFVLTTALATDSLKEPA